MLNGGDGRDELKGGAGVDHMFGGLVADRFEFKDGNGYDRIADFDVAEDTVMVRMASVSTLADFDRVFETASGDLVLLEGTDRLIMDDLTLSDLPDIAFEFL